MTLDANVTIGDLIQVVVLAGAVLISVGVQRNIIATVNRRLDELERIANRSAEVIVRLAALDEWKRQTEFRLTKVEERRPAPPR